MGRVAGLDVRTCQCFIPSGRGRGAATRQDADSSRGKDRQNGKSNGLSATAGPRCGVVSTVSRSGIGLLPFLFSAL